jgi:hypothetical protein
MASTKRFLVLFWLAGGVITCCKFSKLLLAGSSIGLYTSANSVAVFTVTSGSLSTSSTPKSISYFISARISLIKS